MTKFEAGKVTPGALIRYVFRLNRAEFRWIVLSMILLAIVSVAAPIFNEQVFSVVIPNADKALMVQIFLMSAVFVAGVSFSYDGAHQVLDNVTIRAKRGETTPRSAS